MKQESVEAFLANVFLGFISLVLSFTVVEFLARKAIDTRSPFEQRFPVQHYRKPRPYVMFSGEPNTHELNEMGYRGVAPTPNKDASEFRIFMLGGSTLVGGTPPISDLVEELFAEHDMPQVRVYNFGVVSSVSSMELVKIITEITDLSPDMIVMYNGGNDSLHPHSWDPRPGYPFNFALYESDLLNREPGDYPGLSLFAFESVILRKLFRGYFLDTFAPIEDIRRKVDFESEAWKQAIVDTYITNLSKAHTISGAFGAKFFAFYQPLIFFKEPLSSEEAKIVGSPNSSKFYRQQRELFRRKQTVLDSQGVRVVDLTEIYEGEAGQVFVDAIHTLQEAKPKVATAIFETILPHITLETN